MVAIVGNAIPPQRKRVIDAMNLREPDRVPVGLWGTVEGYQNLRKGLGLQYNTDTLNYRTGSTTWTTDVAFELDIAEKLDLDFVRISIGPPGGSPGFREIKFEEVPFDMGIPPPDVEINVDEWGVIRKWTPHEEGGYFEMIGYPLFDATSAPLEEGLKELAAFPWPDPWDEACWQDSPIPGMTLREYCKYVHEETPFALMGQGGRGGLFEQAKYMVGYAKIFSDFIESAEFLDAMLIKLTDIEIEFNKAFLEQCGEYVDWLRMSPEDLASEKTAFLSLDMYERQLQPHYLRATQETKKFYRQKNPEGKIQFHSCGAIPEPFMRHLMDCGVDGYDSLPPKVARHSNPAAKKRQLGEEMFFYGGIDVQETLPWGTPEEVRAEVRTRIWEMAHGGGYLLSSSHRLEHDVPVENTLAMINECHEYGVYPLPEKPPEGADTGEGYEPWDPRPKRKRGRRRRSEAAE
ncbi:MAG: uroporphyrinogen decarboxylase family protein [Methyloligellaceae bacterium]